MILTDYCDQKKKKKKPMGDNKDVYTSLRSYTTTLVFSVLGANEVKFKANLEEFSW